MPNCWVNGFVKNMVFVVSKNYPTLGLFTSQGTRDLDHGGLWLTPTWPSGQTSCPHSQGKLMPWISWWLVNLMLQVHWMIQSMGQLEGNRSSLFKNVTTNPLMVTRQRWWLREAPNLHRAQRQSCGCKWHPCGFSISSSVHRGAGT
jgi:hypothetical protein